MFIYHIVLSAEIKFVSLKLVSLTDYKINGFAPRVYSVDFPH